MRTRMVFMCGELLLKGPMQFAQGFDLAVWNRLRKVPGASQPPAAMQDSMAGRTKCQQIFSNSLIDSSEPAPRVDRVNSAMFPVGFAYTSIAPTSIVAQSK